jgi:Ca2+-binding RTX toxin-like protein
LAGNDFLDAYRGGDDIVDGGAGDDEGYGGADNDRLYADQEQEILAGGAGADTIYAGAGDDTIEGDQGFLDTHASWGVTRTVTQGGDSLYTRAYQNAWWYEPGSAEQGDDTIYAGAGADWVFAQGGNDFVDAGIGDDVVFGEGGDDEKLRKAA